MQRKLFSFLLLILLGVPLIASLDRKSVSRPANDISSEEIQQKDERLTTWIDKLEEYECRNCPFDFRRKDDNGLYSYGCLQFQKETFLINLKKFYPSTYKSIEGEEWQNLIYDCDFQKELAYKMLEKDPDQWIHWKVSVKRGLGKPLLK